MLDLQHVVVLTSTNHFTIICYGTAGVSFLERTRFQRHKRQMEIANATRYSYTARGSLRTGTCVFTWDLKSRVSAPINLYENTFVSTDL